MSTKGNPIKNVQLISRHDFEQGLKRFGLKISNDSICKYIDTYPQNQSQYNYEHPRVFTCDFVDETGHGWANIYSRFYKEHTIPKTDLFREFKEFIESYTFKIGHYYFI